MTIKSSNKILCIKTETLFAKEVWDGIKTNNLDYYYDLISNKSEFCERETLETDINYKQIIPQIILRNNNHYFLHRQNKGGESRLNSLCPLTIGGHVEEFDKGSKDIIETALYRELEEEVKLDSKIINSQFLGLIYLNDENPVNHVHVGLIYLFDLNGQLVECKETGLEKIGFVDKDYLLSNIETLTYWSRKIVNIL